MNRRFRRGIAVVLPTIVVASMVTAVTGTPAWAGEPSVTLPVVPAVAVSQQKMGGPRPADPATSNALHGDQRASTTQVDGGGTDRATSLAPSATWTVSPQTGDFTWSYPLRVPPSPGGLDPKLGLSYSSSSVDGRTSATNNQASWIGDGWDLSAGFIERSYIPCADDTMGGTAPPKTTGDLCWRSDNAVATYGGSGGELIRDDSTGEWRTRGDDGARIQRVDGTAGVANGDDNGEYWKITTPDGTQYLFGSRPDASSTWTVPVYGDDSAEPCHSTGGFAASHCVQAWRWNLDQVIDRNGNQILYNYSAESNAYGMGGRNDAVSYVRGGTMKSVEYGMRAGTGLPATGKVLFNTADRCVPGSDCTTSKKDNWPDVPWDDKCDTATCAGHSSPTFWSTKRLDKITTQVRGADGGYRDVESWGLAQEFPVNGDGEKPALWLKSITHTGLTGTPVTLPPVTFEGDKFANRVLKPDGIGPLLRYRITAVVSETGGVTSVTYAPPDCTPGTLPADPQSNTLRCFPMKWAKKDSNEQVDYFQKYVVSRVTQTDRLGSTIEDQADYEYLDGAAWAYDDSEITKDDHRNWNVFRGYSRVRLRHGKADDPAGPVSMTEQRFYRGMDGDKQPSGTRSVTVEDSAGGVRKDDRWLAGVSFENQVHDGDTDRVVSKTIQTPYVQGPTATRAGRAAYIVRPGTEVDYTALAAGGWRTTRTEQGYDDRGLPTRTNDLGDTSTAGDDKCTTTYYARNTDRWIIALPYEKRTTAVACTATPKFPDDAIAANRYLYDSQPLKAPPVEGNVTRTEELDRWTGADPVTTLVSTAAYDAYGRPTSASDAKGRTTTTAYTPDADHAGPVTGTVVSDPMHLATTTTIDPSYGQPTMSVDANSRKTETAYDALGRKTEVWQPNRARNGTNRGNVYYAYDYHNDAPTVVTTTTLGPNGTYTSSEAIYDGLLRLRQKQDPAKDGGRLITDTRYDSQGRPYKATSPYYTDTPVDDKIWIAADADVPKWTYTEFDGAGRQKAITLKGGITDLWRSTFQYDGDRTTIFPANGSPVTTTITDARGHTVEQRQYHGRTAGGDYDSTKYTYTPAGQIESITDPVGQVWRHTFDLHGRERVDENPDMGTSTMTYNEAGELVNRTDAREKTLTYSYDDLGRPTRVTTGTDTLTEWTYDTAPFGKGLPATSTRYVDGYAYKSAVVGYNQLDKPLGNTVTVPATPTEPELAGTYTSLLSYKDSGNTKGMTYAALPDLPAETLAYTYNDLGQPTTAYGGFGGRTTDYVTDTSYTRYGEVEQTQLGDPGKRVWLSRLYDTNTRFPTRSIVDTETSRPMQSDVHYAYDASGNLTSVSEQAPDQSDTQCFRYDYLRRLTEAWTPANGCTAAPAVAGLGGTAPYWQSFTYDPVGNRLTGTSHAAGGDTVQTSTYPGDDRPHAHQLTSVSTTGPGIGKTDGYAYDDAGNTVKRAGQVLDWDAEGNLAKVTEGGRSTEFVYGADGSRLIRRDPSGTTLYLGGEELRLDKATRALSGTRYYAYGDQTVAMRDSSGLTWLADDHQGTAQLAVDGATLKVVRRQQTPFGGPRGTASAFPGEKGFVGGTNDPSTGLVQLGARSYDPATGRFLSVDPELNTNDPQQMQGYAYADNNPITNVDPTGRSFWDVLGKAAPWVALGAGVLSLACGPLGWVAFGATIIDMTYAATEHHPDTVALDLVGLATFGVGKWLGLGAKALRVSGNAKSWLETGSKASDLVGVSQAVPGAIKGMGYPDRDEMTEQERAEQEAKRTEHENDGGASVGVGVKHANDHEVNRAEYDRLTAAVTAMGPEYWPSLTDRGNDCYRVGVATVGAGSYPCSAVGAVLAKPRKAIVPCVLCNWNDEKFSPYSWVTQRTNLGNGTPKGANGRRDPSEPTWDHPNQGGYYRADDGKYWLKDGHGRAMS